MTKRSLSVLQIAYREFFLSMLSEYHVDSPAKLSQKKKSKFFTRIREEWKVKKAEFKKERIKKPPASKKDKYVEVKGLRPAVGMEPEEPYARAPRSDSETGLKKIPSEPNPEQTCDLKIKYNPNQFFEQDDFYEYPVVKMPKEGSYLKLPRKGRAMGRGYKERDFEKAIIADIPEIEVANDLHIAIPHHNRPYEPDIVLIDKRLKLYVDIEIDEPYDGYYRFPMHEQGKDDIRDLFFTESGWIVIRFTERQVHLQEQQCIKHIKDVLNSIYRYQLQDTSDCIAEPQWDYKRAIRWEKEHYRENYLGIQRFKKQNNDSVVVVDIYNFEGIEVNIERTKKSGSATIQENVAFEDETHTYRHAKDQTGNATYISVTTLIERFFPFDIDRFIQMKAEKEKRSEEDVLDEFFKLRDEAAEKGTLLHQQIERFLLGQEYDVSCRELELFKEFYQDVVVTQGFEFIEAEKKILLEQYNVAGTVDALFKKPDREEYIIFDWKRSKNLTIDGHPKKFGYGYAVSELSHLDNSSYYKYALQQNIYKHILERKYNMRISSMNLIVLHENFDCFYRVPLKTMNKEIAIIFKSLNQKI